MMKKGLALIILLLALGCGGQRKVIIQGMEDRPNANWMMVGKDLRPGDSAAYCVSDFRKRDGKKREKHLGQCRKWTVMDRRGDAFMLKLDTLNAPASIQDIQRTYVVGVDGFIREARAFSTQTGEEWIIRIAGKGEALSLERLVTREAFTDEDLELIDAYSHRKDGRRYLTDADIGPLEVVPLKAVFTPSGDTQRIEYYLQSSIAPFGYVIQINVIRNLKKSKKDFRWVNELQNTGSPLTAPLP